MRLPLRLLPSQQPPKLLDQVRNKIRFKHYSLRTEQAYLDWIRRSILFHHQRHPAEMGGPEVEALLTHLAVVGKVAASTQNQALSGHPVSLQRSPATRHRLAGRHGTR